MMPRRGHFCRFPTVALMVTYAFLAACQSVASNGGTKNSADDQRLGGGQWLGVGAIDFYRGVLSRQWAFHCDFEPSCSTYGRQLVSRYGLFPGSLMIADRLMRDHPYSRDRYARTNDDRPYDPVGDNALFCRATEDEKAAGDNPADAVDASRLPSGSEEDLFRFAESLFAEEEWDRARVEYRRYLFHYNGGKRATRCRERLVICLQELERYGDALERLSDLPEGPAKHLLRALVLREQGQLRTAADVANTETEEGFLLSGLLAMESGDAEQARRRFEELPPELRRELLGRCDAFEEIPSRSPTLGALFSAILPGAGHVYAGRYADGLVALTINATLIGGTVAAALNDEEVTAAVVGTFAFGFYAGNVYGGANAAARFNREHRDRFLTKTRGGLRQRRVQLGIAPVRDGGVIAFYLGF